MTVLWIFIGLIAIGVSLLIIQTLLRPNLNKVSKRHSFALAIFKDQLSELDDDLRRDLIKKPDFTAAKTEIERRLLTLVKNGETENTKITNQSGSILIAIGLAILIPAAALSLYAFLGSPNIPNVPYVTRDIPAETEKIAKQQMIEEAISLVKGLKKTLKNNPDDINTWVFLGRAYSTLARHNDAANAFEKAHKLAPENTEILVQYAEALIPVENNVITEKIWNLFSQVLIRRPLNTKARYYLALGKAQANNVRDAIQDWVDLIAISPKDASWLPTVRSQVQAAAQELGIDPTSVKPSAKVISLNPSSNGLVFPGPTREEVESAGMMSPLKRQKMIRSMVKRLAERLNKDPADPEGWRRLAHAYRVLGEGEKAKNAEHQAKAFSN